MTIRTLVVDDEAHARETLVDYLASRGDFEVVGTCAGGREAVEAIRRRSPDLVLLDVRMPEMDGFQVLEALEPDEVPFVVMVTAYDEHALEAFRHHALAYLLKPFDDIRFDETMNHVRAILAPEIAPPSSPDRLVARAGRRSVVVDLDDVDWIEADGDYSKLHCGSTVHLISRTLGELARSLDPRSFCRIHRSTIVALDRIREFHTDNHRDFDVLLRDGTVLRLSRTYRDALEKALGDRI